MTYGILVKKMGLGVLFTNIKCLTQYLIRHILGIKIMSACGLGPSSTNMLKASDSKYKLLKNTTVHKINVQFSACDLEDPEIFNYLFNF